MPEPVLTSVIDKCADLREEFGFADCRHQLRPDDVEVDVSPPRESERFKEASSFEESRHDTDRGRGDEQRRASLRDGGHGGPERRTRRTAHDHERTGRAATPGQYPDKIARIPGGSMCHLRRACIRDSQSRGHRLPVRLPLLYGGPEHAGGLEYHLHPDLCRRHSEVTAGLADLTVAQDDRQRGQDHVKKHGIFVERIIPADVWRPAGRISHNETSGTY